MFLYTGFLGLAAIYIWTLMERRMNRFSSVAGLAMFVWRLALTTGTGLIFGFLAAIQPQSPAAERALLLASTTSTENSGLFAHLLPLFEAASGIKTRVIAVGTTSLRLLESAVAPDGSIAGWEGDTDIFITPGYQFRAVDGLMTNFHLPKSTLFMLVSALMGRERMQAAYAHAIESGYRFYSYGDSSLLLP